MGIQINNQNIQLNNTTVQGILNLMYPVGSIYISTSPYNPKDIFGGGSTWRQIEDVFLLAAGTTYNGGDTGGEAKHALTVNEIPSHSHSFGVSRYVPALLSEDIVNVYVENRVGSTYRVPGTSSIGPGWNDMANTAREGGGQPHNNMPPYLVVYVWERIA